MIKKIIKNGYTIEFEGDVDRTSEELHDIAAKAVRFARRQETADSLKEPYLVDDKGERKQKGDEVVSFRGEKGIIEGWEIPAHAGSTGRVIVRIEGKDETRTHYPSVWGLEWKNLPWEKEEEIEDVRIEDKVSEEEIKNAVDAALALAEKNPDDSIESIQDRVFRALDIGPGAYSPKDMLKISNAVLEALKARPAKLGDIPVNSPEEKIIIQHTEGLKGGKSPLTSGMVAEAYKNRYQDEGKTFEAYVDAVIESLKEDIANAKYIVSGEMKPVRSLLLEDYIIVEQLVKKAGLSEKLAIMQPLVDELSEKLNLNYWKKPKFTKATQKSASRELRNKHRWDSKIVKKMEPVLLCTETDLKASYNDAKQGKLPQVFEANLTKVEKDMEADYDRINQGRDHYLDDPRIVSVLPKIISVYDAAERYARDLGYTEQADRFAYMLNTIKKGWGLD